jgi:thiamine-monophosphate kinase
MSSEFEFLESIRKRYSLGKIGDDCAVLPKDSDTDMVVTADMLVEDIDFRLKWTTPEFLGHKALAVSLSDIAAMGADPDWAMLSIGVPEHIWNSGFVDRFYEGWHRLASKFGVELVGGDISRTPDKIVIDSIVSGQVEKGGAILRSTANPGDLLFVTNRLGGAATGLAALEGGFASLAELEKAVLKQLQPMPQIEWGKLLQQQHLASAMIDLSDGLSSDLAHLCRASGVGAVIHAEKIPVYALPTVPDRLEIDPLDLALNGGEDFELLFTSDPKNFLTLKTAHFLHIGEVTANVGIIELIDGATTSLLTPKGFRHF